MNGQLMVLASASPRRRELMTMTGINFTVQRADVDEKVTPGTPLQTAVKTLARRKAVAVGNMPNHADQVVIAADTIVALNGKMYGKPSSDEEAAQMLTMLSGKVHQVFTGVCIVAPGREPIIFHERTDVELYELEEEEILSYVKTGEPMDKAGAYGIQGRGALLVKRIDGDYYNVVGLPIARVVRTLKDKGLL